MQKSDKANVDALYEKFKKDNPDAGSNPFSRWRQKQAIKKEYAAAKAGNSTTKTTAAKGTKKAAQGAKTVTEKVTEFCTTHSKAILLVLVAGLLFMVISSMFSSCAAMFQGGTQVVIGTSYTAEDKDIRGAENYYREMEEELRAEIRRMEADDDYDEVRLRVDEIGHNPWQLAAFLTVLYEDYTLNEVKSFLRQIFDAQYSLRSSTSNETVTETKTVRVGESLGTVTTSGYCNCSICCGQWSGGPTASGVYPTANHTLAVDANHPFVPMGTKVIMNGTEYTVEDTGNFARYGVQFDVYYDSHIAASFHGHKQWECYLADSNGSNTVEVTTTETKRILTVNATNHTLTSVINNFDMTDDQRERYELLMQTKGNRPYLFEDDIYANPIGPYLDYDIPGEALTDSLRHSSITYKLKLNGGDMKSVQGDSGHAQVKMVADVYSHIIDDDRRLNAERLEAAFYSGRQATPEPVQPVTQESSTDDKELLLKLLQNPEMAALLKSLAKTL